MREPSNKTNGCICLPISFSPPRKGAFMEFCNDFSHYMAENILHSPASPAHSGPELCYIMPKSVHADTLAREIILDKVSLITLEHPSWISGNASTLKIVSK
jgi:hypothetical protein